MRLGNSAEKRERPPMIFEECLAAFTRKRLNENRSGVRQCHHEQRDLPLDTALPNRGLAKVDLRLTRRMHQRQEHLLVRLPPSPYRILDHRLPTQVSILRLQPLD